MKPLNTLIVGGGGREHALAWAVSKSKLCGNLFLAPGNGGTVDLATHLSIDVGDSGDVLQAIEQNKIDFTIIGPEQPLVDGLADDLRKAGHVVFGPGKKAAQLEGSKAFAKSVMDSAGVPTAGWKSFTSRELSEAKAYAASQRMPIVIKADGLAAGKGVVICHTASEVDQLFNQIESDHAFGDAASAIVVEEFMEGEEASVFAITDGENIRLLPPVQDHKRIGDGDTGPNTGGMGAYLPAPVMNDELMETTQKSIIQPVLNEMNRRGSPYQGVLYVGLMITSEGPKVVEFNCRFGDPECQVLMPAIEEDVLDLLYQAAHSGIENGKVFCTQDYLSCVIMASEGYPGAYEKGKPITGVENVSSKTLVFHSGTKWLKNDMVTAGGRVLAVTGRAKTLEQALEETYRSVKKIHFDGAYYRTDIGSKGLIHNR